MLPSVGNRKAMRIKQTGVENVRAALLAGEKLTSLDAYNRFGVHHLASTIRRLRAEGMAIDTLREFKHKAKGRAVVYARYALAGNDEARA